MQLIEPTTRTYVAQKKLRRLAARAQRVIVKHQGLDPALDAIGTTLQAKAERFIQLYDATHASRTTETVDMKQGRAAVTRLHRALRTWLALVLRDQPDLDGSSFTVSAAVPDDVIATAERLLEVIRTLSSEQGANLGYAEQASEHLSQALNSAKTEWATARASLGSGQELSQTLRDAAVALQAELVALRRVLRAVLGSGHVDYQTLRTERMEEEREDEAFGSLEEDDGDGDDLSAEPSEEVAAE